jgi:hypothetical protein
VFSSLQDFTFKKYVYLSTCDVYHDVPRKPPGRMPPSTWPKSPTMACTNISPSKSCGTTPRIG